MVLFLGAGMTLGLSAGFSPGPLTTLVISHSLRHGTREGLKVAMAPLLTDTPIVLLCIFALAQLRDSQSAFGLISLLGAAVLVYLSYETFKVERVEVELGPAEPRSLGKGVVVNFLSPHAYLFWLTIGGPKVVEAWTQGPFHAAGFVVGFYVCLVGSKMLMAVVAARSRQLLAGTVYRCVMRILGVALLILAFFLLRDGLVYFDVIRP
jgi:threonine/homoserine/homoserine lactone efflux protein